jgi:hypothetical protein
VGRLQQCFKPRPVEVKKEETQSDADTEAPLAVDTEKDELQEKVIPTKKEIPI